MTTSATPPASRLDGRGGLEIRPGRHQRDRPLAPLALATHPGRGGRGLFTAERPVGLRSGPARCQGVRGCFSFWIGLWVGRSGPRHAQWSLWTATEARGGSSLALGCSPSCSPSPLESGLVAIGITGW